MPRYGELDASLSSLVKVQLYIWSQFNVNSPCLLPVLPRTFGPARGVPRTVASVKESPPFASLVRGNPSKPRENTHLVKKQQLPMTRDYKRNLKYFRVDQHFNLCLTRLERIWTPAFPLGLNWKVGCLGLWRLGKRTRKGACLTGKSTGMVLEKVRKRVIAFNYRKRPCISRTFFHKIEAKNQGCGLSMDTSVFGVLKNLINIHKTS